MQDRERRRRLRRADEADASIGHPPEPPVVRPPDGTTLRVEDELREDRLGKPRALRQDQEPRVPARLDTEVGGLSVGAEVLAARHEQAAGGERDVGAADDLPAPEVSPRLEVGDLSRAREPRRREDRTGAPACGTRDSVEARSRGAGRRARRHFLPRRAGWRDDDDQEDGDAKAHRPPIVGGAAAAPASRAPAARDPASTRWP